MVRHHLMSCYAPVLQSYARPFPSFRVSILNKFEMTGTCTSLTSFDITKKVHCWTIRSWQLFFKRSAPMLYYLHPDVSFFKGNGEPQLGSVLDMPDNSAAGDVRHLFLVNFQIRNDLICLLQVWNPPDTESTYGFNYDNCEAKTAPGILYLVKWWRNIPWWRSSQTLVWSSTTRRSSRKLLSLRLIIHPYGHYQ